MHLSSDFHCPCNKLSPTQFNRFLLSSVPAGRVAKHTHTFWKKIGTWLLFKLFLTLFRTDDGKRNDSQNWQRPVHFDVSLSFKRVSRMLCKLLMNGERRKTDWMQVGLKLGQRGFVRWSRWWIQMEKLLQSPFVSFPCSSVTWGLLFRNTAGAVSLKVKQKG